MDMGQISTLAQGAGLTVYDGYAATGAQPPYVVNRPANVDPDDQALCGQAIGWNHTFNLYCVGASVAASYNMAIMLVQALQGARVAGGVLSCYISYTGAQVESYYETQVTAQTMQGVI